jgi:drug/metabolite transporter (DMT)-like permease
MRIIDVLLLLALSAIWGSSFIFMPHLAPLIGPVATADMRMLLAGISLTLAFLVTRFKPEWRKNWKHFLLIGLLNSAIPFVLYSVAALYLPASMSPMFGAIFGAIWLGERLTGRKGAGLLLGVGGVVVVSSLGRLPGGLPTALAILACLIAPMCYGLAGVYIKRKASAGTPRVALTVVAFAFLCSAVGYIIYYRLIADVGPTRALTVTFLVPVFAMLWGLPFLGETVTWSMGLGAAIILAGTFLVTAPQRKTTEKAQVSR